MRIRFWLWTYGLKHTILLTFRKEKNIDRLFWSLHKLHFIRMAEMLEQYLDQMQQCAEQYLKTTVQYTTNTEITLNQIWNWIQAILDFGSCSCTFNAHVSSNPSRYIKMLWVILGWNTMLFHHLKYKQYVDFDSHTIGFYSAFLFMKKM